MKTLMTVVVAGLLVAGFAACGAASSSDSAVPAATAAAQATATMAAATTTATVAASLTAAAGARRTLGTLAFADRGVVSATGKTELPLVLENFAFSPTFVQGTPGQKVILQLTNASAAPHNLSIQAQSIDRDVAAGAKASVEVTIPSTGALLFFCKLHTTGGMNGQLLAGTIEPQVVAAPSAAGGAGGAASTDYGY